MNKYSFKHFLKQCIIEVLVGPPATLANSSIIKKKNQFKKLIKDCILEVLKEHLNEAFDPTSQGPNPVEENPYPAINAHMRQLEEDDTELSTNLHSRYAQEAGAGQFDPRTFGVNNADTSIK